MPGEDATVNQGLSSINDPLSLANGDNPGMNLTAVPFNGTGFLGWSRTVKMALGAKLKLGFIDGSIPKPNLADVNYQRWLRCDYMVSCWLLNSMSPEISSSFIYASTSFDLWKEVSERYGHTNGPLIYQLQRELNDVTHGDSQVVVFFNKLKKCWDELDSLTGRPICSCGRMQECLCRIEEKYAEIEAQSHLMQFLMKFNHGYENVRNQILAMDPLPTVNRAYYIVQQVERQKMVTHQVPEVTAFYVNNNGQRHGGQMHSGRPTNSGNSGQNWDKKYSGEERKFCTYCKQNGHIFDGCFERVGYPDWYKGRRVNKGNKMAANVTNAVEYSMDSPLDHEVEPSTQGTKGKALDNELVSAVCQEVLKVFRTKGGFQEDSSSCGGGSSVNFAGPF